MGNTVVDKLKKFDAEDDVEFYPIAVLYALDVMCGKSKKKNSYPNKNWMSAFVNVCQYIFIFFSWFQSAILNKIRALVAHAYKRPMDVK